MASMSPRSDRESRQSIVANHTGLVPTYRTWEVPSLQWRYVLSPFTSISRAILKTYYVMIDDGQLIAMRNAEVHGKDNIM
jgi:hypothetical protein